METRLDRFVSGMWRTAGMAMLFAGLSIFVAVVPVSGITLASGLARTLASILVQIGGLFVIGGAMVSYLFWTLCGYLVWLPAVLFSRRARTTFAPAV